MSMEVWNEMRLRRFKMFNTNEGNVTEKGFIRINPPNDKRITNLSK